MQIKVEEALKDDCIYYMESSKLTLPTILPSLPTRSSNQQFLRQVRPHSRRKHHSGDRLRRREVEIWWEPGNSGHDPGDGAGDVVKEDRK